MEPRDNLQRDEMTPKPKTPADGANPNAGVRDYTGPDKGPPPEEAAQTLGQWLAGNGFSLVVVAAAIGYVGWKFDIDGILAICKALLGLSFVIFIHELGHFLAAKWCDVHVTTFSIGFGPAIPGCWFQRGETTYKLSLLPLGGYVQMVGQVDGDEGSDGSEEDPRSYRNKTVGQRMLIISAGVIMNAILAFACFIVVYQGPGKDRTAAVLNTIDSGAPAYVNNIRTEMLVQRIGAIDNPNFEDLMAAVVFSHRGEKVTFVGQRSNDPAPLELTIEPRLIKGGLRPAIGVGPASRLELPPRRLLGSGSKGPYVDDSPAAQATPPLQFGDQIVATTDPDEPGKLKDLPRDPRNKQKEQKDFFEFQRRMQRLMGKEVALRVQRADGTTAEVKVPPAFHQTLALRMHMGQIVAVRDASPAAKAGVLAPRSVKDIAYLGDVIFKVVARDNQGKTIAEFDQASLDPERLPYKLRQCADQVRDAKGNAAMKVTLHVNRHRTEGIEQYKKEELTLDWDDGWRFDRVSPLQPDSPMAIPELGLAYQIKPVVAEAFANLIGNHPLAPDDTIKELQVTSLLDGEETTNTLEIKDNWAYVSYWLYQRTGPVKSVRVTFERGKTSQTAVMNPAFEEAWPLLERGWIFMQDERLQKAGDFIEAISLGLRDTWNNMRQVGQTIYGMVTGRLSVKNLGGPITIAKTAYRIAGYDIWEFIFFMGLISINLAVINFLPIPVLDGGHMVFLFYEKLRGKQASEAVRVGATYAGLAIILSLMVFVIWLDLTR